MANPIGPALTPEEWAAFIVRRDSYRNGARTEMLHFVAENNTLVFVAESTETAVLATPPRLFAARALLNAVLPDGDPHKLTREMVDGIRDAVLAFNASGAGESEPAAARVFSAVHILEG